MLSRPASPVTMQELTNAFQHLEIRVNRKERLQDTFIDAANENFAMAAGHINHLYQQVRNRAFGKRRGDSGVVNEPGAFGRPSEALSKTEFFDFLTARTPHLTEQERNELGEKEKVTWRVWRFSMVITFLMNLKYGNHAPYAPFPYMLMPFPNDFPPLI